MIKVIYCSRCRDCGEWFSSVMRPRGNKWTSTCIHCLRWEL